MKEKDKKAFGRIRQSIEVVKIAKYDSRPTFKSVFKDLVTDDTAYGKPSRKLTPIKGLINGNFGNEAEKHF